MKGKGILFHISDLSLFPELSEITNCEPVLSQNPIAEEILLLESNRFLLLGTHILRIILSF